ncbi:small nuclear ribonucleoprotein SM D2 (nucleomorph) [Chroomonas mesostigmatica CCMP1168]|uniref:Small nuclear ribonucleoprotein Sm D2 n=1 Tax=Chroomonas mesostigmatica CCMP1168 TaxID=1195612 RepID=J7G1X7_9CRYP|nr:small nuclear ribonucleoprotein SM D2 [Chroomonas mesostigmatica CCMP1168]|mmetsp:Transcript_25142/g.61804  ORF Transcript_25142/g.61804 Transcript_25142/m.61804 type:complete len:86 (-) Transcript_25142:962-1219(-)
MDKNESPLDFFSEIIIGNRPVMIFIRNNKKLLGYIRAFDRHMNLIIDNGKEIWTSKCSKKKVKFHEKFFPKLVLRGDSIILIVRV